MAAKKTKLNTDLDADVKAQAIDTDELEEAGVTITEEEPAAEDDLTYNMGEIVYEDDDVDEDKQILVMGAKSVTASEDDNEEEEDDEDYDLDFSIDDSDPFLDLEDYDPEDIYD